MGKKPEESIANPFQKLSLNSEMEQFFNFNFLGAAIPILSFSDNLLQ